MCRITSATPSGSCASTALAIASGGPITSQSGAEAALELLAEALEQLDVLGLFAGELQQRAHAVVVRLKLRPGMVEHEREDELLDQAEDAEVGVAADLVQSALLVGASGSASGSTRASDSGMNGFVKSSRLSPPMMSSTRQLTFWEVAKVA